jgi:CheY-like chemotaxis protein
MRGSVLIVHDDLGVGRYLGGFLETNDYRVLYATTGQEALAVLEEDVPRLLVIGVGLPLMGGWKLIEALAHYPDLSRIPRLLVSPGDGPAPLAARALALLEARASDVKPDATPTPEEVLRRVASA